MLYRFKLMVPLTYKDVVIDSDEVELNEQEVALIKRLVSNSRGNRYGLMPILQNDAPELYDKSWKAIEQPLRDTILEDGHKNGYSDDENEDGGLDMDCVDYICQIPDFAKCGDIKL